MSDAAKAAGAALVKIAFRDRDGDVETLWAFDLGNNHYQLDSTPWFQYGVSYKDVVEAYAESDGTLFFSKVIGKSGHRTVRVQSETDVPADLIDKLVAMGCSYEGTSRKYVAFDIPRDVALEGVVAALLEADVNWEHADPTYQKLHKT